MGRAMDSRGDKQFSFTDSGASEYGALQKRDNLDLPTTAPSDAPSEQSQAYGDPKSADGSSKDSHMRTGMEADYDGQPLQDSETALRSGQAAGQVSNVPGTTSSSPNGGANAFGTGGLPIFAPEGPAAPAQKSGQVAGTLR